MQNVSDGVFAFHPSIGQFGQGCSFQLHAKLAHFRVIKQRHSDFFESLQTSLACGLLLQSLDEVLFLVEVLDELLIQLCFC